MCGIAGFTGKPNTSLIQDMARIIRHRGPDSDGYYIAGDINLGNVRLSIIDIDSGKQPIFNEDKSVVVVYNGEIYNYTELRKQLELRGHKFGTRTDTEVIVHLYEDHGMDFINKLYGIFAFALWDIKNKKLFLVRDHLGVKPLHYYFNGNTLVFGSEIKAILLHPEVHAELNYEALHLMLNWRFVTGKKTLFKGIFKVMPGSYLEYSKKKISTVNYWKPDLEPDYSKTKKYFIENTRELFINAVKRNMVSDVPVGAFLSGGIDSTAIVGAMSRYTSSEVNTYTLGFNTPEDECEIARKTANVFHTKHYETTVEADPLKTMPETIWYSETPKINIIQQFLISQFASSKVKVILSGQGGDELFAGQVNYDYVNWFKPMHNIFNGRIPRYILNNISKAVYFLHNRFGSVATDEYRRGVQMLLSYGDRNRYYSILRNVWDYDKLFYSNIYAHPDEMLKYDSHSDNELFFKNNKEDFLNQVLLCEINKKLVEDGLHIEDRMSMAWSLEARVPFLDKDLVEFSMKIPPEYKIKNGIKKFIFKEAFKDIIPKHVINRQKQGFGFNPYIQMKRDLKHVADKILTKERINKQGIFNYSYIRRIIDHPPKTRMRWHYFYIWNLIGFQIWYDMFINRKPDEHVSFDLNDYINNR